MELGRSAERRNSGHSRVLLGSQILRIDSLFESLGGNFNRRNHKHNIAGQNESTQSRAGQSHITSRQGKVIYNQSDVYFQV